MFAMRFLQVIFRAAVVGLVIGSTISHAGAAIIWDEASQGDFSGDRLNPTPLNLSAGVNSILATTTPGDLEYVRINLPAGGSLTGLVLQSFVSDDDVAFIGMQSGTTFTFAPADARSHIADLLAWTHFGPNAFQDPIPVDILPTMGQNADTPVSPPFSDPSYTFWIQQTGGTTSYQFDFIVSVPEPASWLMFSMAGVAVSLFYRRALLS